MTKTIKIENEDRKRFVEENIDDFSQFVRSTIDRRMDGGDPFYVTTDFLLWLLVFVTGLSMSFSSVLAGLFIPAPAAFFSILTGVAASAIGIVKIRRTVNRWRTVYP